jgi:alpha-beta hydrolase superfamily lysophospholipase
MIRSMLKWMLAAAGSVLLGLGLIAAGVYWVFLHRGPAPSPWHTLRLADFTASQAGAVRSLDDYLALEQRLFQDLRDRVYVAGDATGRVAFNRYSTGSLADPGVWPVDWNRSFRMTPPPDAPVRCAALLLHGLTDSPYSLRSIGEHLAAGGCEVVGLRLPGHGTAPSGLLTFQIEDMRAAVRLAARDLAARGGDGRPLLLVGYSNGAALAVDYALDAMDDPSLPKAAGLVLLSPAIAVSKLAVVGRIKTGLSSLPGFERAAWEVLGIEFDPFKYVSFSFHAAGETFRLTRQLAQKLERRTTDAPLRDFPPVLVFLSTVDATVKASAVTDTLLDRLASEGHELVLFDVNRQADVQTLLVADPGPLTQQLRSRPARSYDLTVITNANDGTFDVVERRSPAGSGAQQERPLGLAWPRTTFSLSHVALTFPPDDPLYGYAAQDVDRHVQLGRIEVRGESGVLAVPTWLLTRQRSNPFHGYVLERIDGFVAALPRGPN